MKTSLVLGMFMLALQGLAQDEGLEILHEQGDFKIMIESDQKAKMGGEKPKDGDKVAVHY